MNAQQLMLIKSQIKVSQKLIKIGLNNRVDISVL